MGNGESRLKLEPSQRFDAARMAAGLIMPEVALRHRPPDTSRITPVT